MSSALKFVPPRVAFTDPRTGFITREWYLFLQGVFDRIGGSTGESMTDLAVAQFEDAGIEELKASLFASVQDSAQAPPAVALMPYEDLLLMRIDGLQDQIAEMTKTVQDLMQAASL